LADIQIKSPADLQFVQRHQGINFQHHSKWHLPVFLLILTLFIAGGLFNLYSSTGGGSLFRSQIKNLIIGCVLFLVTFIFGSTKRIHQIAFPLFAVTVLSLLAVLIFGKSVNGSQRWLQFGGFQGQPSELAKITVALFVAKYFSFYQYFQKFRFVDFLVLSSGVGCIFGLIAIQPDLGTAGICAIIAATQMLLVKWDKNTFRTLFIAGLVCFGLGWKYYLHDYQKQRILTFINPSSDPLGAGYNIKQSLVAVGSGQLWGKGYQKGTQTQLSFLPAKDTDFIFSVLSEEHGFMIASLVLLLVVILTVFMMWFAWIAKDTFGTLATVGIAICFFSQSVINIAMVLGLFPVVGMPLPFYSHGGSSVIGLLFGLGIVAALAKDHFRVNIQTDYEGA